MASFFARARLAAARCCGSSTLPTLAVVAASSAAAVHAAAQPLPGASAAACHFDGGCCAGVDIAVAAPSAGGEGSARPPLQSRVAAVRATIAALAHIFDVEQMVTTDIELEPYGKDWHGHHSGLPPDVVVFPRDTAQVSALLQLCSAKNLPVVARGAGTSLEGHITTPHRGVCVDFSAMNSVLAVRPDDLDVTVQPGVRWQDLNEELKPHGLFFAMDPGPGATIGGMVGTGCSGTNAVRYGTMKANVINLTAVLADGTVLRTGSRARKTSAGYDLTSLFVGSEGTLGLVTEATLKLHPLPQRTAVAVCSFPSVRSASDAVLAVARAGVQVGAVELLDAGCMRAVNAQSGFNYPHCPHVFFKFSGSPAKVADDAAAAQAAVAANGGTSFEWTMDAAGQARLWEARKVALWSVAAQDTSRKVATTDVCVPLSRLPDLMADMEGRCASSCLAVAAVGHVGDGNVHHFIAFDPEQPAEVAEAASLNEFLVRRAQGMGGTCTGEHGVGVGKTHFLEAEYGAEGVALMRALKAALDPRGILNPGKKLPPLAAATGHGVASSGGCGGNCSCRSDRSHGGSTCCGNVAAAALPR